MDMEMRLRVLELAIRFAQPHETPEEIVTRAEKLAAWVWRSPPAPTASLKAA